MSDEPVLFSEETVEEAARVLADALHADEPGTPYDLAEAVLNSAGVRLEVQMVSRACAGLAKLVRDEYPVDCSLAEIAETWGTGLLTADEVAAITSLHERALAVIAAYRPTPVRDDENGGTT